MEPLLAFISPCFCHCREFSLLPVLVSVLYPGQEVRGAITHIWEDLVHSSAGGGHTWYIQFLPPATSCSSSRLPRFSLPPTSRREFSPCSRDHSNLENRGAFSFITSLSLSMWVQLHQLIHSWEKPQFTQPMEQMPPYGVVYTRSMPQRFHALIRDSPSLPVVSPVQEVGRTALIGTFTAVNEKPFPPLHPHTHNEDLSSTSCSSSSLTCSEAD